MESHPEQRTDAGSTTEFEQNDIVLRRLDKKDTRVMTVLLPVVPIEFMFCMNIKRKFEETSII